MTDNAHQYGFRWATNVNGMSQPKPELMAVDSAINFTVSGTAGNFNLNAGDPVKLTANGTVTLAGGNENGQTPDIVWGVVVGMGPVGFFNGTRMVRQQFLQSGCTYGTAIERQSQVLVVRASAGIWEVDCDGVGGATAATYLAYQAFIGENCDPKNIPIVGTLQVNPFLNIASHAVTSTLAWRIVGVGGGGANGFSNQDYSGANVKMLVSVNKGSEPFYTATGI